MRRHKKKQCKLIVGLFADANNLNQREVQTEETAEWIVARCKLELDRNRPEKAPPPPGAVKLLLPTRSFNIKLPCDFEFETRCFECVHLFACKAQ